MKKLQLLLSLFIFAFFLHSQTSSCFAQHVMKDTTIGNMKIALHVMAAEPFYTKKEVKEKKITEGMLIIGGAKPVSLNAQPAPDHHLVVHIYNAKTGKAITHAKVLMSYQQDSMNKMNVPVVIMQEIGEGTESTHYGNNVSMGPGSYTVMVTVNGKKFDFMIRLTEPSGENKQ